jgi:hypothetical protein
MADSKNTAFLMILTVGLICSSVYGQEAIADPDQWQLSVTPYFWFAGVDGHVTARGNRRNVDISFSDIWDAFDFGALIHIEARKEKWGFFADPIYMNLSQSRDLSLVIPGPADIVLTPTAKADLTMWIVEFGGFYQIGQWRPAGDSKQTITLDVLGGGRYWDVEQNISIGPLSGKASENWIDPFIGARLTVPVNNWLLFYLRADIGGFAVSSDASEQTWNIFAGPAITLSDRMNLVAGYRWLNLDREKSSNTESNVTFAGAILGLTIRL